MMAQHLENWLGLLEGACAKAGLLHLDIILDQAASERPLLASVRSVEPALAWQPLFEGLPEGQTQHLSPLLVRVDLAQPLHRHWLRGVLQASDGKAQLLALVSAWPFSALAIHLSACLEAGNGGRLGLLRYYDPRLFPLLFSHVLRPEQQLPWLRPAELWSWLDRDGVARHLPGLAEPPNSLTDCMPIELGDDQVETLCCAGDAVQALDGLDSAFEADWGAERRFQFCYHAMLAATQAGLLLESEREAFVLKRLSEPGSDAWEMGVTG